MTQDFENVTQAFEWFMENVFPTLPTEEKLKLKDVKHDYKNPNRRGVSEKRMKKVLIKHGKLEFIVRYRIEDEK